MGNRLVYFHGVIAHTSVSKLGVHVKPSFLRDHLFSFSLLSFLDGTGRRSESGELPVAEQGCYFDGPSR